MKAASLTSANAFPKSNIPIYVTTVCVNKCELEELLHWLLKRLYQLL